MKVFVQPDENYSQITLYVLHLIACNKNIEISIVAEEEADIKIGQMDASVPLAYPFYQSIENGEYTWQILLDDTGVVSYNGQTDHLATIYYLSNCIQECQAEGKRLDQYGRFRYQFSCQSNFNTIEQNVVQEHIDRFCAVYCPSCNERSPDPTRIFISHDIDAIYGSFVHDTLATAKRGQFGKMFNAITANLIQGPQWFCIDEIVRMHEEKDLVSTFFWMTEKGKDGAIQNADYAIGTPRVVEAIQRTAEKGFRHGLHKSTFSSKMSAEKEKLPIDTESNRYHYLKFQLPAAWDELHASGMKLDASLGYAEHIGFRNSYGMPFTPFNLQESRTYGFVEAPLHIMDVTLNKYMNIPSESIADRVIGFFEGHKENCVLSILWHNMYFVEYQFSELLREYKKILLYLYESGIRSITPDELVSRYHFTMDE